MKKMAKIINMFDWKEAKSEAELGKTLNMSDMIREYLSEMRIISANLELEIEMEKARDIPEGVISLYDNPVFVQRRKDAIFDVDYLLDEIDKRTYLGICHVDDLDIFEDYWQEKGVLKFSSEPIFDIIDEEIRPIEDWVRMYIVQREE